MMGALRAVARRRAATALLLASAAVCLGPRPLAGQDPAPLGGTAEERAARHFEAIRDRPPLLAAFLRAMPKGGDLHSHLGGAVYAESMIAWAAEDGRCIVLETLSVDAPPCDAGDGRPPAAAALEDPDLYDRVVDAWSLRNWHPARLSGHARFFGSFSRFRGALDGRAGDALAEVTSRAAAGRVSYLELMHTPELRSAELARAVGWDPDLRRQHERMIRAGLADAVAAAREYLDRTEARRLEIQRCGTRLADPGCDVEVRYLYQVLRAGEPEVVFGQILAGFATAASDPRVVGINLVQPEDRPRSIRDYSLHMRMIEYLRPHHPEVRVTLHAGELAPGLVPPEALRSHIRQAVEVARADRIGHGVAIMHEDRPFELLRLMAERGVLVEICLTSNDVILGVQGAEHPLRVYLEHGVPVALATDDEGVARSEMSMEYLRAALDHDLEYPTLKTMARASLQHAFVEGGSLWADAARMWPVGACSGQVGTAGATKPAASCRAFLEANTRARLQWELEAAFAEFESGFADTPTRGTAHP